MNRQGVGRSDRLKFCPRTIMQPRPKLRPQPSQDKGKRQAPPPPQHIEIHPPTSGLGKPVFEHLKKRCPEALEGTPEFDLSTSLPDKAESLRVKTPAFRKSAPYTSSHGTKVVPLLGTASHAECKTFDSSPGGFNPPWTPENITSSDGVRTTASLAWERKTTSPGPYNWFILGQQIF
jgi:hypothetical protein